jgi:iron(III) transport system permease protein
MRRWLRHLPGGALSVVVLLLLTVFIAVPIGAVLKESMVISGPMPLARLKEVTSEALALLPEDRRTAALERWAASPTEKERLESLAAAFRLSGLGVPWDVKAAFSDQTKAADAALAGLDPGQRAEIEQVYPLALAMLHKRIALAFQVRDKLSPAEFDRLRAGAETRLGFDHYLAIFEDPYLRRAALNSLRISLAASAFTLLIAFALAYGINRGGVPRPALVRGIVLLPLVAPPTLIAVATLMLFGRRGLVTHTLLDRSLGLINADETNIYGAFGVIVAQTLSFVPAATIVLDNVLRKQDGRIEEAAASLGASRWTVFREVTLPMAWPGIKRALILVFILSLTDFGNPLVLGRGTPVIAGIIYDEMTAFRNTALSAALCVWLILPALAVFLALENIGRRRRYTAAETSGGPPELPLPLSWRMVLTFVAMTVATLVIAIYTTMALGSVTRIWGVDWTFTLGYFTGRGTESALTGTIGSQAHDLGLVWNSVRIAGIAGPIGGLLGIAIAYVVDRIRPPGANLIAFLALIPAILPGIIFGLGYIIAFNLPLGIKELSLTGTATILVINILFANLFVGVLAGRAALQRLDSAVDEAAESLGAGLFRRFVEVTLPMLRSAFLLGALYVFVDGMTTLSSVIFLVSGDHNLASVAIFNHANSSNFGFAAAKSVAVLAVAALAMAAIAYYERRFAFTSRHKRSQARPEGTGGTLTQAFGKVG